jgi:bacillithiol biosynthesis cysteine-adding enzyme BshC
VLTGQQAGLFGGPLFTLLKALTAVKLADQVSRDHGVTAVPIFWVEAEDHDWNEVRSLTVFDDQLALRTVELPPHTGPEPLPVAELRLDASIGDVLDELRRVMPRTEFTASITEQIAGAYQPGTGMADAFARWLERLLGDRGLVVYDASDSAAKPLAAEVFAREVTTAGRTRQLAASAGAELTARGYHTQVHSQEDTLAIFLLRDGRHAVRHQDGRFFAGDQSYTAAELLQRAQENPAGFSPSVLLRPIVQDTVFPTVCYVGGPSELAYLAQLRGVYEHFGVPMPLVYPRASATVLDSASHRFLAKYQLPLEALHAQDEAALNALLEAQIPGYVEESFAAASQAIDSQMHKLVDALPAIDPTLQGAAQSTLGRMQHDLQTLHGKMIQAAKRRDETLRRQFTRARALAFPGGHAQERAIGFVWFLNQYGPGLLDRLVDGLPLDIGHHWIITV